MESQAPARVLILSDREVAPAISRCATYEFEDVASAVDTVDLLPLGAHAGRVIRRIEGLVPGLFRKPSKPDRAEPYDLLFVSLHSLPELARLHPLGRILRLARRAVINVDEIWTGELPYHSRDLGLLRRFDQIFTACAGGLEALRNATRRPCDYLAPYVDALRFAPSASPPRRIIDIHLMGRRRPALHESLRETAAKTDRFYLYDTVQFNPRVSNHADHRGRLADLVQRTRYFVVDVANSDRPDTAGGQEEFGPRYVEGAAGGAILIGRVPRTSTFESQFWPGAVQPIEPDSAAITRVLEGLEQHPERLERRRRTNVAQVLRRHDGVYRWEQILRSVGLEPLPALNARKQQLDRLASSLESEDEDR